MVLTLVNMFTTYILKAKQIFHHRVNIFKMSVSIVEIRKSAESRSNNSLSCFIIYKNDKAGKGSNIYNREAKIMIVNDL